MCLNTVSSLLFLNQSLVVVFAPSHSKASICPSFSLRRDLEFSLSSKSLCAPRKRKTSWSYRKFCREQRLYCSICGIFPFLHNFLADINKQHHFIQYCNYSNTGPLTRQVRVFFHRAIRVLFHKLILVWLTLNLLDILALYFYCHHNEIVALDLDR